MTTATPPHIATFKQGRTCLVKPHGSRPNIEGRRVRTLCGRGGTVVALLTMRIGLCPECRQIEAA